MIGNQHFMKENELSRIGKFAIVSFIIVVAISAIGNIYNGHVKHPSAFWVVLLGFVLFTVAKVPVILHKRFISFGSSLMTENMANVYRLGYWLMIVGLLFTFV
jgi:hypothetical protein